MPYIKELATMTEIESVTVVSPVENLEERKKMGWENGADEAEDITIIISPSQGDVEALFNKYEESETWCMFSGINAFPEVSSWFKTSIKYNVKRGIITEPPYIYEHPLWQHAIRFALKDWKYTRYIDKFFVMGDEYVWYYKMWSRRWEVIPFMYCTEWRERSLPVSDSTNLKVLYVGSLSHRKNVSELLKAVRLMPKDRQREIEVGLVGDGDKRSELECLVKSDGYEADTRFFGNQRMEDIPAIMQQYDVLVLPSLHDGWGAVVNEAQTLGLYVICSDHCGAKYLLKDMMLGGVYKSGNEKSLTSLLLRCQDERGEIRKNVAKRIQWARENISGKAIAKLFISRLLENETCK